MSAANLISRLQSVKETGRAKWLARCPVHEDKRPSLCVSETTDGRVLLHCWAGCATYDVLKVLGLEWADVMPERVDSLRGESDHTSPRRYSSKERRPFNAHDVLACISHEALIASIAASHLARGVALSDSDRERLSLASARLSRAAEIANDG